MYEVKQLEDKLLASSICRHDTGTKAVMNGCCHYDGRKHVLAAGLDEHCHIYTLKYKVVSPEKNKSKYKVKALIEICVSRLDESWTLCLKLVILYK